MTEVYPIEADGGGVRMKLIFKGADGNPKPAMLLMCSKGNPAKIQSAHVV